eukprot:3631147-Amphidinium_carterae.1
MALSSGESEYYSILKAAAQELHTAAARKVCKFRFKGQFAQRLGLGRQRHVHTRLLWIQEQVAQGRIGIQRVDIPDNEADLLTKPLAATLVRKHLASLGFEYRTVWSMLHRGLAASAALSPQEGGLEERTSVKQRVAALELQLQALQRAEA